MTDGLAGLTSNYNDMDDAPAILAPLLSAANGAMAAAVVVGCTEHKHLFDNLSQRTNTLSAFDFTPVAAPNCDMDTTNTPGREEADEDTGRTPMNTCDRKEADASAY
jgi:hypothetical protein